MLIFIASDFESKVFLGVILESYYCFESYKSVRICIAHRNPIENDGYRLSRCQFNITARWDILNARSVRCFIFEISENYVDRGFICIHRKGLGFLPNVKLTLGRKSRSFLWFRTCRLLIRFMMTCLRNIRYVIPFDSLLLMHAMLE